MSGTDKHMGNNAPLTAAEQYRQTADEHVRTLKDFWKDFLVSGLFVLAAIVIIFACLAWFAANNSVSATGSTISAKGARFTLSSVGTNKGYYEQNNGKKGVDLGELDVTDSMLVAEGSSLNNWTKGELGPGSYGKLEFTVTPLANDVRDVTVSLGRCIKTRDGKIVKAEESSDIKTLLMRHVLFFRNKDENGYYSDPVLDDTITIKSKEFGSPTTEAVTKTLYWVWPEQFQNFALTGSVNYSQNLFEKTDKAGYQDLLDEINDVNGKDTWTRFFKERPTNKASQVIVASANMSSDDLETCSDLYDQADEAIGSAVEYVQIRFSAAEEATTNGNTK